ncbi:MAG: prenyltransferase [Pseudomonadota bacterium]|nr:prenyltransferase [Pseudomonadota bacterium]
MTNVQIWGKALTGMPRLTDEQWEQLDPFGRWLICVRASVLLMTFSSSVLAGLLALYFNTLHWGLWCLVTLGLCLAHATNNLINDATDYWRGIDKDEYFRNQYGVQPLARGLVSSAEMIFLIGCTGLAALAIGLLLLWWRGELVLQLLLAGCFFVLFYTWPLKKWGLGEPAVLLVWGPLMVGGGYYVITGQWSWLVALISLAYALGPTCVLFGKHIDKLAADAVKGVRTLPVILGDSQARRWVQAMLVTQYAIVVLLVLSGCLPWPTLLVLLGLKSARRLWQVYSQTTPDNKPERYPESVWPLWFSAYAFAHTRLFGGWLFLGLVLGWVWDLL